MTATPLILNGFIMNVVGHVSAGLWRHPADRATEYVDLDYWIHIARLLDEAGFDALFIADALGQLDVYGGTPTRRCAPRRRRPSTIRCCWCRRWPRPRAT